MEARDWAALPRDLLLDVFYRLGPREVRLGAEFACTAWRRAALEEPTLWRRVGVDWFDELPRSRVWDGGETAMAHAAVDRAGGQCEAFVNGDCDDEDLLFLVQRAPSLKTLGVAHHRIYDEESEQALVEALTKLTLLEDLQIYFRYVIYGVENMLRSICQACPHLKRLVLTYASAIDMVCIESEFDLEPIDGGIPMMHELRCLRLYECNLTRKGLKSILESCPLLETLEIEGYFCQGLDKELLVRCASPKNLSLPTRIKPGD